MNHRVGDQAQLPMMPSHRAQDKARLGHEPAFHKKRFWQPADQDGPHHDPTHPGFCLRNLETSLSQAMRLHRRHSSSGESAPQSRRVRLVDPIEVNHQLLFQHICSGFLVDTLLGQDVQFREVILPRSASYDGSTEQTGEPMTSDAALVLAFYKVGTPADC